jgi:hypothetical protein
MALHLGFGWECIFSYFSSRCFYLSWRWPVCLTSGLIFEEYGTENLLRRNGKKRLVKVGSGFKPQPCRLMP